MSTYTDSQGAFTLTGVKPGNTTLAVTPPDGSGLAPMSADLTARLDAESSVRATVVDSALVDRIASVTVSPAAVSVGVGSTWPCTGLMWTASPGSSRRRGRGWAMSVPSMRTGSSLRARHPVLARFWPPSAPRPASAR